MRRELRWLVSALTALGLFASSPAWAEPPPREPLVFVGDPKMGTEASVRTFDSLGRFAFRYDEALPDFGIDDRTLAGKVARFFGRSVQLVFIDEPIADLTTSVAHEMGGHGARARELGLGPTFLFYPPGIYRRLFSPEEKPAAAAYTQLSKPRSNAQSSLLVTLGGVEANYVQSWWINARIVRSGGWVHFGDLLTYGVDKLAYFDSFLSSSLRQRNAASGNDVASYVDGLQDLSNGWRAEDRVRIARRLTAGYLWNLADPTLLYALYGSVVSGLFRGQRSTRMPLPTLGRTTMLLSPRFGLTPFGAEQILDLFLSREGRLLDVYARVGTSGLASYYGAGARLLGVRAFDRLTLGGELDLWRQPQVLLDERYVFDPPSRAGVNVGLFGDVRLTKVFAITGKLAAKTAGYVMGQPIDGGLHGYVGLGLALP